MALLGMLDPTALSSPLTVMRLNMGESAIEITTRQFFEEEADARASKEYAEGTMAMLGVMIDSPEIQELVAGMAFELSGTEVTTSLSDGGAAAAGHLRAPDRPDGDGFRPNSRIDP